MNAPRFFGIILRIGQGIAAALGGRAAPPASAFAPTSIDPTTRAELVTEPAAIVAQMAPSSPTPTPAPSVAAVPVAAAPVEAAAAAQQPEAAAPAPKMRSIEEIRADLARLRQNAKERHAEMLAQRDQSFAATDLMDIVPAPPEPKPAPSETASETAFAATAFVDFGDVKSRRAS